MKNVLKKLMILGAVAVWAIIASACAKPPKAQLTVSKNQIRQGESVSVEWKTQNAKEVLLNGKKVGTNGTEVYTPTENTTYEILGRAGKKEAKDSKSVQVEVLPAGPTITLNADPGAISVGAQATLRWSSQRADRVEIPGLGSFGPSGETKVSPTQSITYTATAKGPGGDASASARVTVTAATGPTGTTGPLDGRNVAAEERFKATVRSIFFDFDKSDLRDDAKATLDRNAQFLTSTGNNSISFRIEGNCDPRGSEEYNLALGDKRANAAKSYLVGKGVDPSRMDVISNGKRNSRGTSEGSPSTIPSWANDRRADFIYVRGGDTLKTLPPAPADNK
ncbi:MAG: OmpA family protein [Acidobacteria bacterium]|nr:OmpA family protein [Acidobacteriota bacterium]